MVTITRPLLAGKIEDVSRLARLRWPMIGSPKVDGVRCIVHPELGPVSRSFKPLPNASVGLRLSNSGLWWLDGELVAGEPTAAGVFNSTQSAVMTRAGLPALTYLVFDHAGEPDLRYHLRLAATRDAVEKFTRLCGNPANDLAVLVHETQHLTSPAEALIYEESCLRRGWEGIMLRDPAGPYKSGRSSLREGILLKLKRTEDAEARVTGFEPLQRNLNPIEPDAFGLSKRGHLQENKVEVALLGTLIAHHPEFGEIRMGSGFDAAQRMDIWRRRDEYAGRIVCFKYQKVGTAEKPRFPIFKGFRDD